MNRRKFLKALGLLSAGVIATPKILVEKTLLPTWSEPNKNGRTYYIGVDPCGPTPLHHVLLYDGDVIVNGLYDRNLKPMEIVNLYNVQVPEEKEIIELWINDRDHIKNDGVFRL